MASAMTSAIASTSAAPAPSLSKAAVTCSVTSSVNSRSRSARRNALPSWRAQRQDRPQKCTVYAQQANSVPSNLEHESIHVCSSSSPPSLPLRMSSPSSSPSPRPPSDPSLSAVSAANSTTLLADDRVVETALNIGGSSASTCSGSSSSSSSRDGGGFALPTNDMPSDSWLTRATVTVERSFNQSLTDATILLLDTLYAKAELAYSRFYVLETIARVPYFAYVSVLHMYESFGWWRRVDLLKLHFDESVNELHHLAIMEALGGDKRWIDRFLAQHIATVYYFFCVLCYLVSPRMAYHFSECVEVHAYHTYDKFLAVRGDELKHMPPPKVAVDYYGKQTLYSYDEGSAPRQNTQIESLYDVFVNVRDDEAEHCRTMRACQSLAPRSEADPFDAVCSGFVECVVTSSSAADRMNKAGSQ